MQHDQLGPGEQKLLWEEILAYLDRDASSSPSYDHFRERIGCSGWSFDLAGDRRIAGFVDVSGPKEQVQVTVHLLDGQEARLEPLRSVSLREVWKALTVPGLPLT